MIIVELSSGCRRQSAVGGADSSVSPITHIISPDHSLQLFHSVVLRLVLTAVEQFFFHSCPHTFTACIIMTSSAGILSLLQCKIHTLPAVAVIILVFFVDLYHFICKCLILPKGVFMAEMIVKCLSCNLQSLAVKTDPSCDPTVISLFGNEL